MSDINPEMTAVEWITTYTQSEQSRIIFFIKVQHFAHCTKINQAFKLPVSSIAAIALTYVTQVSLPKRSGKVQLSLVQNDILNVADIELL
jgi:hypothetical protein